MSALLSDEGVGVVLAGVDRGPDEKVDGHAHALRLLSVRHMLVLDANFDAAVIVRRVVADDL